MIQFTTPTLQFVLKDKKTKEVLDNLQFDYLILTFKSTTCEFEKVVLYSDYHAGTFEVKLTQEETGQMDNVISIQANIMVGENRFATLKASANNECNLHNEVIDG